MLTVIGDFSKVNIDKDIFSKDGEDVYLFATEADFRVSESVRLHADMQYCYLKATNTLYCTIDSKLPDFLRVKINIVRGAKSPFSSYPNDAVCNVAICGKYAIGSLKCVDPVLLKEIKKAELDWIDVNQGYTGCSSLTITSSKGNGLITSDSGIAKACSSKIDVLLIPKQESISLPGHSYGFIGGIGGIFRDIFYVTGKLGLLTSSVAIKDYLDIYGVEIVELRQDEPIDIGGLVFIKT